MKSEDKLEVLLTAIREETNPDAAELNGIRTGLLNGLLRIAQVEIKERQAMDPCINFPVERVQEGFAFWNSGGFYPEHHLGRASVAAGMDGERLRVVRYMQELNGRHTLVVVYPGCFFAIAAAKDSMEASTISVYQLLTFQKQESGYAARCRKVLQSSPYWSRLPDPEKLNGLMEAANRIATSANLKKMRDWI